MRAARNTPFTPVFQRVLGLITLALTLPSTTLGFDPQIATDCTPLLRNQEWKPEEIEPLLEANLSTKTFSEDELRIFRERKEQVQTIEKQMGKVDVEDTAAALRSLGFPGTISSAETFFVYRIDLSKNQTTPTFAPKKLEFTWKKAGKVFPIIEIALVKPEFLGFLGIFYPDLNLIRIALPIWLETFHKGQFPATLAHELRHAAFDHFEDSLRPKHLFYRTQIKSLYGERLRSGPYTRFLSLEEAYTFPRFVRTSFQSTRDSLLHITEGKEYLIASKASAFHESIDHLLDHLKQSREIVSGALIEFEEAYHHVLAKRAQLRVPFGRDYGVIEATEDEVLQPLILTFPCPGCSKRLFGFKTWGDRKKALRHLEEIFIDTSSRLRQIEETLKTATTELERIQLERNNTYANYRQLFLKFEEARKKMVRLLQDEGKDPQDFRISSPDRANEAAQPTSKQPVPEP